MVFLGTPAYADSAGPQCGDLAERLEKFLSTRQITVSSAAWTWKELTDFHNYFLESMALDPANVPLDETPTELIPENMNVLLHQKLDALVESRHIVDRLELGRDFDTYVSLVEELLNHRRQGLYTRARRVVKRGPLHEAYNKLVVKMQEQGSKHMEFKVSWNQDASAELVDEMQKLSSTLEGHGGRNLASFDFGSEKFSRVRNFLFFLIPIVFLTGMTAGILLSRKRRGRISEWVRDNSEPRL